jgi:hypothetical protein
MTAISQPESQIAGAERSQLDRTYAHINPRRGDR